MIAVALALVLVALAPPSAGAQVYRWVDGNGVVHYTDHLPQQTEMQPAPAPPGPPEPPAVRPAPEPPPLPAHPRMQAAKPATPPRPLPPPLTIGGAPPGPADAERERADRIDEIFRLAQVSLALTPATQADDGKREERDRFRRTYVADMQRCFRAYYVDAHAKAALGWLRSPLGRKIASAAAAEGTPSPDEVKASLPGPSAERRRVVARLDGASQVSALPLTVVSLVTLMMQAAMLEVLPQALESAAPTSNEPGAALEAGLTPGVGAAMREGAKQHFTPDRMRSIVDEYVDETNAEIAEQVHAEMTRRLQAVPDDELARAVQFFESPPGRWLGMAIRLAARDATVEMAEAAIRQMRAAAARKR
jgi:hypothetical protein